MDGLSDIDPVVEELVEHPLVEQVAIPVPFAGSDQFPRQTGRGLELDKASEDVPDPLGVGFDG